MKVASLDSLLFILLIVIAALFKLLSKAVTALTPALILFILFAVRELATVRRILEAPPLQVVEAKGVVVSATYTESGRLVNDADQLAFQENELPTLGKLTVKLKSNLDG